MKFTLIFSITSLTLDANYGKPVPFSNFNKHSKFHQFYNIGCFCTLLFKVLSIITVFKVTKEDSIWKDTWVAACGSYKTSGNSGCGYFG